MFQKLRRVIGFLAILAACTYIFVATVMWFKQRDFLYNLYDRNIAFESLGLEQTQLVWLKSTDGAVLESFYRPAPPNRPVILYFHGNGSEASNEATSLEFLAERGFGYLAISYRGFGKSVGQPTEKALIEDAETAYNWLRNQGISENHIMLLGLSLGSGVAVQLAAQKPVAAVALGAPFTSTADVAAEIYWYLPVHLLMLDKFMSSEFIRKISVPLFILHGESDSTISVRFGKRLFELANEPKQIKLIAGQEHQFIFHDQSMQDYADFFERVFTRNLAVQ